MDPFGAIEPASQGDRTVTAYLWLEALRLMEIPAGTFMMGSPKSEAGHYDGEGPQHQVTIPRPFKMSAVQASQGCWEALMGANPSRFLGDPALPVEQVSWDDICGPDGFLERLNVLTEGVRPEGMEFRLPSEAEWEHACRAGTVTAYGFGDDPAALADHGWFDDNANGKTNPVGQKRPNAWGLHDLHGNVLEWCQDVWHDNCKGAPKDGSAWASGGDQSARVLRGGSWNGDAGLARSAYRGRYDASNRYYSVGFRVVCVPARTP
jgi:formylglycine-generating enzyme required for sulfatase activity